MVVVDGNGLAVVEMVEHQHPLGERGARPEVGGAHQPVEERDQTAVPPLEGCSEDALPGGVAASVEVSFLAEVALLVGSRADLGESPAEHLADQRPASEAVAVLVPLVAAGSEARVAIAIAAGRLGDRRVQLGQEHILSVDELGAALGALYHHVRRRDVGVGPALLLDRHQDPAERPGCRKAVLNGQLLPVANDLEPGLAVNPGHQQGIFQVELEPGLLNLLRLEEALVENGEPEDIL